STLTNGFGTRKRRTSRRVLLPESGSTEIAARIGECVAPSCAHAIVVHSTVAVTASGRITMYLLVLALISCRSTRVSTGSGQGSTLRGLLVGRSLVEFALRYCQVLIELAKPRQIAG